MFVKRLFAACQDVAKPVIDPALAVPVIHGGDYETFERQMTAWHKHLSADADCELKPVRRAGEPSLTVTAVWGDYVKDSTKAARWAAMEAMDQLAAMRKPRN